MKFGHIGEPIHVIRPYIPLSKLTTIFLRLCIGLNDRCY